jgi:hypothetical protein
LREIETPFRWIENTFEGIENRLGGIENLFVMIENLFGGWSTTNHHKPPKIKQTNTKVVFTVGRK